MKSDKGQVLVLFVLLMPIFLLLLALVIDVGLLYIEDKHLESSVRECVLYGLENRDDYEISNKIESLIEKNTSDDVKITIHDDGEHLQVSVVQKYQGLFPFLFKNNIYEIEVTYYGYLLEGNVVIQKE